MFNAFNQLCYEVALHILSRSIVKEHNLNVNYTPNQMMGRLLDQPGSKY